VVPLSKASLVLVSLVDVQGPIHWNVALVYFGGLGWGRWHRMHGMRGTAGLLRECQVTGWVRPVGQPAASLSVDVWVVLSSRPCLGLVIRTNATVEGPLWRAIRLKGLTSHGATVCACT